MHLERYSIIGLLVSTLLLWPFDPHHPAWVECLVLLAAWWVVPLGLRLFLSAEVAWPHWLMAAGILLLIGMGLAAWYALRPVLPSPALSIPEMYAWHGSMNTLALILLMLGWQFKNGKSPIKSIPSA